MSWFFGKKKPQPEVFVATETAEGFTVVSAADGSPYPNLAPYQPRPYPQPGGAPYPPAPAPYPPAPAAYPPAPYPPVPREFPTSPYTGQPVPYPIRNSAIPAASTSNTSVNPLESVPFTLSPLLSQSRNLSNAEVDLIKRKVDEVKSKLSLDDYNYDFQLERSVMREANSVNN